MAVDPFTVGLSAAQLISQMIANKNSADLGNANLQFQRQNADKMFKLGTAGRTDAYGNKVRYSHGSNEWETLLDPFQKDIIDAGEKEQYASLTEDATRNRGIKRAAAERGRAVDQDFDAALAGHRYDQPQSEVSIRDELQKLITGATSKGMRSNRSDIARQLIRSGGGSGVDKLYKDTNRSMGEQLAQTMLQARQGALGEAGQRTSMHQSKYLPAMQQFAALASQGGDAPIHFSDTPSKLLGVQDSAAQGAATSLAQGGDAISKAYMANAKNAQDGALDIKGIASLISAMRGTPAKQSVHMKDQSRFEPADTRPF